MMETREILWWIEILVLWPFYSIHSLFTDKYAIARAEDERRIRHEAINQMVAEYCEKVGCDKNDMSRMR